jgi:hypothetical protein
MYPMARDELARSTMSHALQHQHVHLAEFSAAKRAEAAGVSAHRTRARRAALAMPRLRLMPRRWATHS